MTKQGEPTNQKMPRFFPYLPLAVNEVQTSDNDANHICIFFRRRLAMNSASAASRALGRTHSVAAPRVAVAVALPYP